MLLEYYELFSTQYEYRPTDIENIPFGEFARRFGDGLRGGFLHNYGALQSLQQLLALLEPGGFVLINDYGQTDAERGFQFEHQRFSQTTAVGLNFALLKAFFAEAENCSWVEPEEEMERIRSRLVGRHLCDDTGGVFARLFGKNHFELCNASWNRARGFIQMGRFDTAISNYKEALTRQPNNWLLMQELAHVLTFVIRDPETAAGFAQAAIEVNPNCSSDLWSTLGDAYYEMGFFDRSEIAYQRAISINPSDVRAHYNLSWIHLLRRDYAKALVSIAEGLALDEAGEYTERLLQKQAEIVGRLAGRSQKRHLLNANRLSVGGGPQKPSEAASPLRTQEPAKSRVNHA